MPKKKTTAEFIIQAKVVHGDRYDYSNTVYKTNKKPIEFLCLSCKKTINLTANNHLIGFGCKKCHPRFPKGGDLLSQEVAIKHFKSIHGDRYDYSKVKYLGSGKKVAIICKECDQTFMQTPRVHKRGSGCPACNKNKKLTQEQVIEMFEIAHNGKYDYSKVVLENCKSKVEIICKQCNNTFWQRPSHHKRGSGCPYCANNTSISQEDIISSFIMAHGSKYSYNLVEYVNSTKLVTIKCNTCEYVFDQKPITHKRGSGCPKCANNMIYTQDQILKYFIDTHGDRYDYSRVKYKNSLTKVEIGCNLCEQWFFQKPTEHKRGSGCPNCHCSSLIKQEVIVDQFKDTHGTDYDYSKVQYTGN